MLEILRRHGPGLAARSAHIRGRLTRDIMRRSSSLKYAPKHHFAFDALHNNALRKIGKCSNHPHHHPSRCRGRIDGLGQTTQSRGADPKAGEVLARPNVLRRSSPDRCARSRRTSAAPLGGRCPDRRWRLWRSRSALLKYIANLNSNAIPFCNAAAPANQLLSGYCETGRLRNLN